MGLCHDNLKSLVIDLNCDHLSQTNTALVFIGNLT